MYTYTALHYTCTVQVCIRLLNCRNLKTQFKRLITPNINCHVVFEVAGQTQLVYHVYITI